MTTSSGENVRYYLPDEVKVFESKRAELALQLEGLGERALAENYDFPYSLNLTSPRFGGFT